MSVFKYLIICSFIGLVSYAQFNLAERAYVTLDDKHTILVSYQQINTFDSAVQGKGRLQFFGKNQKLNSRNTLEIANSIRFNADQLLINATLQVHHQLIIKKGLLQLRSPLGLNSPRQIVLEDDARINPTSILIFYQQLQESPQAPILLNSYHDVFFRLPELSRLKPYGIPSSQIPHYQQSVNHLIYGLVLLPPPAFQDSVSI